MIRINCIHRALCAAVLGLAFILPCSSLQAQQRAWDELLRVVNAYETTSTGISVVDVNTGKPVFNQRADIAYKPASVQKLVTSAVALLELGSDYRFETKIYVGPGDSLASGSVKDLYVRGGGDPNLTTEDLWMIARSLKRKGLKQIGKLHLDDSVFVSSRPRQGQRAFQAASSGLSYNFNSLQFEVCPGKRAGEHATVTIDPWEYGTRIQGHITTILGNSQSFQIDELKGPTGTTGPIYIVKGNMGDKRECTSFYRSVSDPVLYFSRSFVAQLRYLGISLEGTIDARQIPPGAKEVHVHKSKALSQILEDLNHYSSNFIAEQVLTIMGDAGSRRHDRDKALVKMAAFLGTLGYPSSEYSLQDGSGLSHANRISARVLTRVLYKMYGAEALKAEYIKSLSVAGHNGTLRTRRFGDGRAVVRAKTGTLNGVSSLAGYIVTKKGRVLAFSILQNGVASRHRANMLEQKFLDTLYEAL